MATIDEIRNLFMPMHEETKKEIQKVGDKVENIQEGIKQTDAKIEELQETIEIQERKIEQLERKILQKNLIILGLEEIPDENTLTVVLHFLKNVLQITDITELEIDDIKRLGRKNENNTRPILLELTRKTRKYQLLQNAKLLKGTKISIVEHLPHRVVEEQKILRPIMRQARSEGHYSIIKYDKININGNLYTSEELAQEKEEYYNEETDNSDLPKHHSIANLTEDILKSREYIPAKINNKNTEKEKSEKRKANSPLERSKKKNDNIQTEQGGSGTYRSKKHTINVPKKSLNQNTLKNFMRLEDRELK